MKIGLEFRVGIRAVCVYDSSVRCMNSVSFQLLETSLINIWILLVVVPIQFPKKDNTWKWIYFVSNAIDDLNGISL